MDSKEVKAAVKSVKDLMDAKDFKAAIRTCKNILKSDRNNYLALVFFGACLQETEQRAEAPKAFKKAIEVSPEQTLAWKGLISYYEKFDVEKNKQELFKCYAKLIKLENDETKWKDFTDKFQTLLLTTSLDEKTLENILDEIRPIGEERKKKSLLKVILFHLSGVLPDNLQCWYEQYLDEIIQLKSLSKQEKLEYSNKYMKCLYKTDRHKLIQLASGLLAEYENETSPLEWLCKVITDYIAEELEVPATISIEIIYTSLLSLCPTSSVGLLCKGAYLFKQNSLLESKECIRQVLECDASLITAWIFYIQCNLLLFNFSDAEFGAKELLQILDQSNAKIVGRCKMWLCQALAEQDNVYKSRECINLVEEVDVNALPEEVVASISKAYFNLKKTKEAEELLQKINNLSTKKLLVLLNTPSKEDLLTSLRNFVKETPACFDAWLHFGKLLYSQNDSECVVCFLQAAKLNPWCFWSFLYLGHCYKIFFNDLDKARRCYQKAYQLNCKHEEAGAGLSDIYQALGKEELNLQLLTAATQTPNAKWAWLRLGLHYLAHNQLEDAVHSLRVAVRCDPNDQHCWESLADAYLSRGAFTSALKSYERVVELDPSSLYPALQIAAIKQEIGLYEESVCQFRHVLLQDPLYIPSLKGHADACFASMNNFLTLQLNGLAADRCCEGIQSILKCLQQRKDLICIWQLLGDLCVTLASLPDSYCKLTLPEWLLISPGSNDLVNLNKSEVLQLATRCYWHALGKIDDCMLWYNLAVSYNERANYENLSAQKKLLRQSAYAALKKSLKLKENWEARNLLGIVLTSKELEDYKYAQHAFIKALLAEENNPITWTNIGALYLTLGDLKLANQSFTEAQKADPDYVECWIGQAHVAEVTGHDDAMDLFRHTTQLGIHSEGCLGYAHMVCQTLILTTNKLDKSYLYNIKNMNAVTVASDAMVWYTDRMRENACAFNMLGLLLEQQKLHHRSAEAFAKALQILKNSSNEDLTSIRDQVCLNYGRVLLQLSQYEEALTQFKSIKKATFVNQCGLALAYFKSGKYEDAYNTYQTTLEWLANDDECKSQILVGMAAVVYMFQGQDDAKILLVQASQLKPPSVNGLFACCALGMLHGNLPLSELVFKELSSFKDKPEFIHHVAFFEAYIHLLKGENKEAVRSLCKASHRHPAEATLWLSLASLLLHLYPSSNSQAAANCAEKAMLSGRASIDVSKVLSLVSLSNLLTGSGLKSLRSSIKAVHIYPDKTENWIVLIASVFTRCLSNPCLKELLWLKKIISYVRRKLEASKQMTQWLSNYERKINLVTDDLLINK